MMEYGHQLSCSTAKVWYSQMLTVVGQVNPHQPIHWLHVHVFLPINPIAYNWCSFTNCHAIHLNPHHTHFLFPPHFLSLPFHTHFVTPHSSFTIQPLFIIPILSFMHAVYAHFLHDTSLPIPSCMSISACPTPIHYLSPTSMVLIVPAFPLLRTHINPSYTFSSS